MMRLRVFALIALGLFFAAPAFAAVDSGYAFHNEERPASSPQDNLAAMTGGTVFLGTDKFLSVWDYPVATARDVLAVVLVDKTGFNAGLAKSFANAYLAVFYGGKLFDDMVPALTGGRLGNVTSYDAYHSRLSAEIPARNIGTRNNLDVLVGVSNVGIKLSYNERITGTNMTGEDYFTKDAEKTGLTFGYADGTKVDNVTADLVPALEIGAWWRLKNNALLKLGFGASVDVHHQSFKVINSAVFDSSANTWSAVVASRLNANYMKPEGFVNFGMDFGVDSPHQTGFMVKGGYALWQFRNLDSEENMLTAINDQETQYSGKDSEIFARASYWYEGFFNKAVSLKADFRVDGALGMSDKYEQNPVDYIRRVQQLITVKPSLSVMVNTVVVPGRLAVHTGADAVLHSLRISSVVMDPPPNSGAGSVRTETLYLPDVALRLGLSYRMNDNVSAEFMASASSASKGLDNFFAGVVFRTGK